MAKSLIAILVALGASIALLSPAKVPAPSKNLSTLCSASSHQSVHPQSTSPFHNHPPKDPLPKTLDPVQFADNPAAFVAYSLAAQIPEILYQIPCACPCRETLQHQSLFDCFRTHHGLDCDACKKEVVFCFEAKRKGMSVSATRQEIQDGRWASVNLPQYAKEYTSTQGKNSK
jgi:hypothetical protein